MGFSHVDRPDGLSTTSLSQGDVRRGAPGSREGKWDPQSKVRGGREQPPLAGVCIWGQPEIVFSS